MRIVFCVLLIASVAAAQGPTAIDGKSIQVTAADSGGNHMTLALPCATKTNGHVAVVDKASGATIPATLRDGQLVLLCEELAPGTTRTLGVSLRSSAAAPPLVAIKKQDGAPVLDVSINGKPFTAYHYSNDEKKPYLWPVLGEGGVGVTRDFPMAEIPQEEARDHVHHRSLYSAYGELNGVDCWAEGGKSGYQHSGEVTFGSGDAYGWIRAKNVWQDNDHKPVIDEEREYRFYATPEDARLIDVTITFTASHGDVEWGDTKEGGLVSVRMHPELSGDNAHITNALGDVGEDKCWGKPSPWCDYAGELEDIGWRGIAVFGHPANFRHPTSWHVRKYGLMGANCFGYSYFGKDADNKGLVPENGDFLLEEGKSLTMRYRVYVHSGDVKQADVAGRYTGYATPPKAEWID